MRHTGDLGWAGGSSEGKVRHGRVRMYSQGRSSKICKWRGWGGESNHDSKISCSVRTIELPFTEMRKNVGESKFWREDSSFGLGLWKFKIYIKHPSAKLEMWIMGLRTKLLEWRQCLEDIRVWMEFQTLKVSKIIKNWEDYSFPCTFNSLSSSSTYLKGNPWLNSVISSLVTISNRHNVFSETYQGGIFVK